MFPWSKLLCYWEESPGEVFAYLLTSWWAFSLILADSSVLAFFLFVFNKSDFKMSEIIQYNSYKIVISPLSFAACLGKFLPDLAGDLGDSYASNKGWLSQGEMAWAKKFCLIHGYFPSNIWISS